MPKVKVEKIKVGDYVCTPGDRKTRWVCGEVHKIELDDGAISLGSRDWATESSKKYGSGIGYYTALPGESLMVKPKPKR
jgi:hypothetical protein